MIKTNVFFDVTDFQVNWPDGIYGPEAKYHKLTHHESHLSRRFDGAKWYIKSSGEGYPSYMREVESASAGSTFDQKVGGLEAGALVFIDLDQDTHPTNPNDPDLEEGAATTAIPGGSWSESAFNGGLSGKRGGRAGTFYWYVKSVFIVHVGGTRCVTRSIDHIIQIHARITWGVVVIRAIFFIFFLYV